MTNIDSFISFIETPPLWKGTKFDITQFIFPVIDLSQFIFEPIPDKIRLGHQMEHIFHQLVSHSKEFKVLAHNLPVKDENRTIGEIDFILQHTLSKEFIHVELTYKFYLLDSMISKDSIHQLIGPNRKDTFFKKAEKIKHKQFQLLHTPEGIEVLKDLNIDHKTIQHKACFKSQVFVPYQYNEILTTSLNNACIVGFWINSKGFNTSIFQQFQYFMPIKSEWILQPSKNTLWKSHQEIMAEINNYLKANRAPMIWIKKSDTVFDKCFVVWW